MDFTRQFSVLDGEQGWVALFYELHEQARRNAGTQRIAKLPQNRPLNRYKDVHPMDETRVILRGGENDYINANHVKVEDINRSYILSQGPLPKTTGHFWQMVWQQETHGIIMLNRVIEKGMRKCHSYWPTETDVDEPITTDGFQISFLSCETESSYCVSKLSLKNLQLDKSREVVHFHYTQWPDFGVPQTSEAFLDFLLAVRKSGVLSPDVGPCVVHCSAGIGRSGTFCLVDVCLEMIRQSGDYKSIDIPAVLLQLRQQRLGLIQTPDQLRFSYKAILDGIVYLLGMEILEEENIEESESDELEDEGDESSFVNLERRNESGPNASISRTPTPPVPDESSDEEGNMAGPPPLPPRDWFNDDSHQAGDDQPPSKKEKLETEKEDLPPSNGGNQVDPDSEGTDDDDDDDEEEEEEDEDDEDDGDEDYSKPKPKRAQRKSKDGGGKQKRGTPVKRGRGRPRKVQQKTGGDGGNSAVKKRGRGRPRKAK
eukprot:m.13472 g.13472  ORF g.13472 m.13472 type:complete len:485 (+) comp24820_c0_seq1:25-1479(+)